MRRILVVQTGFHGDVILSSPVWSNLKAMYPQAEIFVLTTPQARELVCYHPAVEKVLVFDKRASRKGFLGLLKMAKELAGYSFDAVFCLHKSWRTAVLMRLSRIPVRYGFTEAAGAWFYIKTASRKNFTHEVLRNLSIFQVCAVEPTDVDNSLSLYVSPDAQDRADRLLGDFVYGDINASSIIGIAPGSVWATKRWTVDGFCNVAKGLIERGLKVVLIGGPSDAFIADAIEKRLSVCNSGDLSYGVLNIVGKVPFIVSAGVIKRCKVLLTNDSAPMHIAASLNVPVVCVFCATVPEFGYGPWGVKHRIHGVSNLKCRPCARHGMQYCPSGTHACQLHVNEKEVLESVLSLC